MGTFRPGTALTFDDVLLVPRHSSVHPRNVDVRSRFTRGIPLNLPLVSAAMDTVTESEMAMAIAREGGIGVIHKNMPIDRQAAEVDRVKRSESGMILHPITLGPDRPLREAVRLMERFRISGVPVVDDAGRLVGIITNRDLQFERELDRPIRAAMTQERLVTAPVGTTLEEAERILAKHRIEKLPVVDEQGHLLALDRRGGQLRGPHLEVADGLAPRPPAVEDRDAGAHPLEDVEEAGPRRVQVHAVDAET